MISVANTIAVAMRRMLKRSMRLDHDAANVDPVQSGARQAGQLYVHIPFCPSLCPFCTFHRTKFRAERALPYFAAVHREIDRYHEAGFAFQDLYIGGGTPTVLPDALGALIDHARSRFALRHIAVETNPSHLTEPIMARLAAASVNRLSVGVQSFDDGLLARMGRHAYGTRREIIAALEGAQGYFATLNVDMMFNLPARPIGSSTMTSTRFCRSMPSIRRRSIRS
ncbi:MAG: radical SAM protein [Gammaproteobacteria bacterium]|nr:radical SAM protein [Gammaproteobacteria bacterium]